MKTYRAIRAYAVSPEGRANPGLIARYLEDYYAARSNAKAAHPASGAPRTQPLSAAVPVNDDGRTLGERAAELKASGLGAPAIAEQLGVPLKRIPGLVRAGEARASKPKPAKAAATRGGRKKPAAKSARRARPSK